MPVMRAVTVALCLVLSGAFVGVPVRRVASAGAVRRARGLAPSMGVGADVKTIAETVQDFNARYRRPIVPIWRSPLNDLIQVTHLSCVQPKWAYDAVFGYGLVESFDFLLAQYPMAEEANKMRDAAIGALALDVSKTLDDHKTVKAWLEGKSEADVLAGGDPIAVIKGGSYTQSRASNLALVYMMEAVGADVNDATVKKWAEALEQKESLVQKDMELYKQNKDKIEQGMQMVKALEIREKKRMAAALEEKAKKAQAAADAAAKASATEAPAAEAA